jgi:hypothetical protein
VLQGRLRHHSERRIDEALRMAKKLDPYRKTARMALLELWLVEAALARLGRTLSPADQRIVMKAAGSEK